MFRNRALYVGIIVLLLIVLAIPADAGTRRILMVGDSWPTFMWAGVPGIYDGRCMLEALTDRGYGQWEEWGSFTVVPASFAFTCDSSQGTSWAKDDASGFGPGVLDLIKRELINNPSIDIVHLSLGGNDYGRANYSCAIDYTPFDWQSLVVSGTPTDGTFTITFNGVTTPPLAYNATAADIQAALNALSSVGGVGGTATVTDTSGGARFFCQFGGSLAGTVVQLMTIDNSALVGGTLSPFGVQFSHGWQYAWGADTPAEYAFFTAVASKIRDVIEWTLDVRPGVRVCLCDYDLMDTSNGGATVPQYNQGGMRLGYQKLLMTLSVSQDPRYLNRCWFLGAGGLMQYHYGYPNPLQPGDTLLYGAHDDTPLTGPGNPAGSEIAPAGSLGYVTLPGGPHSNPPYSPLLGGDPNYPSPVISILPNVGGGNEHLEREGYVYLSKYCVDQLYGRWLDLPVVLGVNLATPNPVEPAQIYNPTSAQQLAFEIEFSKPVTGVDESNVTVQTTGNVAGAKVLSVSPAKSGSAYTVVVDRGVGEGTLGITVVDDGNIRDGSGTKLAGDISGTFTLGDQYTISEAARTPVAAWPALMALLVFGAGAVRRRR